MKKNYRKNHATYTLTDSEKKSILEAYNIFEKLLTELDNSACDFEPQDEKFFCARINGDEILPLDELEDLVTTMENMITVNSVSCSLEDEYNCN